MGRRVVGILVVVMTTAVVMTARRLRLGGPRLRHRLGLRLRRLHGQRHLRLHRGRPVGLTIWMTIFRSKPVFRLETRTRSTMPRVLFHLFALAAEAV